MEQYEIEYKYLVDLSRCPYQNYPFHQIEQAYISTAPVIRVRRRDDDYILTVKSSGLVKHLEYELPLSADEYENLLLKAEGVVISKKRYLIPYAYAGKDYTIELDIFEKALDGLVIAEVEFSSLEEAEAFTPPTWFLENVSTDRRYHNSYLSEHGPER